MKFKLKIILYWLKIIFGPKFKNTESVAAFQYKQLEKFANKTLIRSPFYSKFFSDNKFHWNNVPQISKKEFMESFDGINTQGIKLEDAMEVALNAEHSRDFKSEINGITVGLSTGTSGKRGIFLVSLEERAQWVSLVMTRVIKPKLFKKQKVAFFLRANSNLYASISSGLFEFKYFDIFKPMDELMTELNAYQPHILASQPSILIDIAKAQKMNQINIEPIQLISFAEVLHLNDKESIESIFKTQITEVYQCTEGFLGASCKFGTMHLNEDFIQFEKEWIDDNKFYPIITDFTRQTQPVVKYKLNDVLQIKERECECGSKLLAIEKIIGRDDDVLIINNIKVYPDLLARKIALKTDSFQKYSITQVSANELCIEIDCIEVDRIETEQIFKSTIADFLSELGIENVEYEFQKQQDQIVGNKTRKIKRLHYEN
jgi:putative adenylate-forming enzyme